MTQCGILVILTLSEQCHIMYSVCVSYFLVPGSSFFACIALPSLMKSTKVQSLGAYQTCELFYLCA